MYTVVHVLHRSMTSPTTARALARFVRDPTGISHHLHVECAQSQRRELWQTIAADFDDENHVSSWPVLFGIPLGSYLPNVIFGAFQTFVSVNLRLYLGNEKDLLQAFGDALDGQNVHSVRVLTSIFEQCVQEQPDRVLFWIIDKAEAFGDFRVGFWKEFFFFVGEVSEG